MNVIHGHRSLQQHLDGAVADIGTFSIVSCYSLDYNYKISAAKVLESIDILPIRTPLFDRYSFFPRYNFRVETVDGVLDNCTQYLLP